jgi:hypothetical protein
MDPIAKLLILGGLVLILLGGAWHMGWLQALQIGRLPGDIYIEKENLKIYIPMTSGILISILWAVCIWIWRNI